MGPATLAGAAASQVISGRYIAAAGAATTAIPLDAICGILHRVIVVARPSPSGQ